MKNYFTARNKNSLRDEYVLHLKRIGWTHERIGKKLKISHQRVGQIINSYPYRDSGIMHDLYKSVISICVDINKKCPYGMVPIYKEILV